jgi:hypothetical protein
MIHFFNDSEPLRDIYIYIYMEICVYTTRDTEQVCPDWKFSANWRRKLQERGNNMETTRLQGLKKQTIDKYASYNSEAVEILVRRIPVERGGGFSWPFFTSSRFALVSEVWSRKHKTRGLKSGGVKCSVTTFAARKNAWDQAAEAERCSETWLLMPRDYNTSKLDLESNYFCFGQGKRTPASSTILTARLKKSVGLIASAAAQQAGVPAGIKTLLWQQPTKNEWRQALQWLCVQKKVSVVSHLMLCRQGCQRPIDMSRLSIADLMSNEAGNSDLGNQIPYLAFLPEGGKMMGVGQHTLGGVARARDNGICAVFFACLRLFSLLVWDPSSQTTSPVDLSTLPWDQWIKILLFPAASHQQTHSTHRGQFSALVKEALLTGAGINPARMHQFNMCTNPRSDACIEMFAGEVDWDQVQQLGTPHMCIYVYIHICKHICVYIYAYIHMYIYTYTYVYIYVCIYMYVGVHMYICICVNIYIHMCVCIFLCITYIFTYQTFVASLARG